jgi:predicted secreted acid phosphatase
MKKYEKSHRKRKQIPDDETKKMILKKRKQKTKQTRANLVTSD